MSVSEFIKELGGERAEGELLKIVLYSLVSSILLLVILYFVRLRWVEGFIPQYGFYLFLAAVGYSFIIPAIYQVRSYKVFPCMSGMMIGMTIGMVAGFMAGMFLGATNGMFVGTVFGMAVGIPLGIWNGRCCGVMGVMEGTMAGFMAGPMGAMTSVMLLSDHLKVAVAILTVIGIFIVTGLNYMIYKEMKHSENRGKEKIFTSVIISVILTLLTTWLMVFGPKSFLFQ